MDEISKPVLDKEIKTTADIKSQTQELNRNECRATAIRNDTTALDSSTNSTTLSFSSANFVMGKHLPENGAPNEGVSNQRPLQLPPGHIDATFNSPARSMFSTSKAYSEDLPDDQPDDQPLPNFFTPGMIGRRHSVDSNIGRTRPPTFVRTYREAKWKRVSRPPKLLPIGRTSSAGNLLAVAAASSPPDCNQSQEYISGTHIRRQRVPIFVEHGEPPDPLGRRASAGDLIPVAGASKDWAASGKFLVIRDLSPSKVVPSSVHQDDETGSSSSSDESAHGSSSEVRRCEFSLIDEDDEEDLSDDEFSDPDEETSNSKQSSVPKTATPFSVGVPAVAVSAGVHSVDSQKHDLRRLVLENSTQKKTLGALKLIIPGHNPLTSFLEDTPTKTEISGLSPSNCVSFSDESSTKIHNNRQTAFGGALMISGAMVAPMAVAASIAGQLSALGVATSDAGPFNVNSIDQTHVKSLAPLPSAEHLRSDSAKSVLASLASQVAASFNQQRLDHLNTSADAAKDAPPANETNPEPGQSLPVSPMSRFPPSSPVRTPWVKTSTKIEDGNVYVSSVHSPEDHLDITSARWISPRLVDGVAPIRLDGARVICVEKILVPPTSAGQPPLHFQKVSYSSGCVISSAQWVAPVEAEAKPSGVTETTASAGSDESAQSDRPTKTSNLENTPSSAKSRRKLVLDRTKDSAKFGTKNEAAVSANIDDKFPTPPKSFRRRFLIIFDEQSPGNSAGARATLTPKPQQKNKRNFEALKPQSDSLSALELDLLKIHNSPLSPTKSKRKFGVQKTGVHPFDFHFPSRSKISLVFNASLSSSNIIPSQNLTKSLHDLRIDNGLESSSEVTVTGAASGAVDEDLQKSYLDGSEPVLADGHLRDSGQEERRTQERPIEPSAEGVVGSGVQIDEQVLSAISLEDSIETIKCIPSSTIDDTHTAGCSLGDQNKSRELADSQENVPDEVSRETAEDVEVARPGSTVSDHFRVDTGRERDDKFLSDNAELVQIIFDSISPVKNGQTDPLSQQRGGSTVAIDNKIEQAMDLVKRHLMYAVREEVEILKQQIGEMMERIGQLEYENNVLRSEAKPETLSKLMQSRIPSASQPIGQSQSTHQTPQATNQPQSVPQQQAPAPSAGVTSQLPAAQPQSMSGQPGLPPSTT